MDFASTTPDSASPHAAEVTPGGSAAPVWDVYSRRQRRLFLLILFLVSLSNYVDRTIVGVLLEPIKNEFRVSDTMLGFLTGIAFTLFYATLGIPIARWADRGDRRLIITAALAIWSMMTILCGAAQSFWQLALMRVGVAVGEAGAIPPSQSLLADYYAPERRAKALGILLMSATLSYLLGLGLGGWVAQNYGWRTAFVAAGAPGLLLAMFVFLMLHEPRRMAAFTVRPDDTESVAAAVKALSKKKAYVRILISMILHSLMSSGAIVFIISFMTRLHGLSLAQAGALFGAVAAAGSITGNLLGGAAADWLAKKDVAWFGRLSGYSLLLCWPLFLSAFLAPSVAVMAPMLLLAFILMTAANAPIYSALHFVCGSKRRATAVALILLLTNLIGFGLGPIAVGALSDTLAGLYGPGEGLRYALAAIMVLFVPSGLVMLAAARQIAADAED